MEFQIAARAGRVQIEDTGDGLAVAFLDDPTSPAECVSELRLSATAKQAPSFRAGIHTGPVIRVGGLDGEKFTGMAFADAKRVMDACPPGEVLLSWESARILRCFDRWKPLVGTPRRIGNGSGDLLKASPLLLSAWEGVDPWQPAVRSRRRVAAAMGMLLLAGGLLGVSRHAWLPPSPGSGRTAINTPLPTFAKYVAQDLGPASGNEQVCLSNHDQIVVGYGASTDCPPAFIVDGTTGLRRSLGRPMYRPQISTSGQIAGLSGHSILYFPTGDPKGRVVTVLKYEAVHGSVAMDPYGTEVFFYNAPGGVAGRWCMWNAYKHEIGCSLDPTLDDVCINSYDHIVGRMRDSVVTYNNEIYASIATDGLPVGISDTGTIALYHEHGNLTSLYNFSGRLLASIPSFDPHLACWGLQTISSSYDERLLGHTARGWAVYDVPARRVLPIELPGWHVNWVSSINAKNEMLATASHGDSGLRLVILRPQT
ncbi:MAG: hypothetical protein P4L46_02735 [Fimbriimonas sp.]|nr:hypothetical protein [Fimbriimonas sp.]